LQSGNLAARVKVRAGGEIGDLEQGVNQMAGALEESQQVLRLRVEQATEALRQTVAELETRNRELEEARQLAIRAGRERTEFLARMSHEIRTPLNAVVGFTRLLQSHPSGRSSEEHIRIIQHAAEQLLHVINDILQFIRLDAGAEQPESLQFDLGDVLEDAVAMLGPMASDKDLELVLLLHSDLPEHVYGDPSRLSQVIVNLVNNAIKFTPQGQVMVEAARVVNESAGDSIEIAVTDTGIGLDPEEQNRVFAAFAQGDSSVTRRFGGTGLGLSIARRLVELMGGSIGIDSSKGQGSRFWFRLPCPEQCASAPIELAGPLAGRQILVYDSNPFVRRSLRSILAVWGIQVFNTGSWKRVSEMVQNADTHGAFSALIVGLSGPERRADLVERYVADIRRHYRGYVLLLTGSETWTPPDQVRDATPLDWATKPIRRATLRRLLAEHLAVPESQQQQPITSNGLRALLGMQVLVAEDNEFNRLLLRRLLEDQGATVDEAVTGLAAVSAAKSGDYDVILMDLHMPELDGAAAAARIRAALGAESPPIFALTADVFGRGENDTAVFDAWLLKPIDADQLLRRLAALREPQGQAQAALLLPEAGPSTLPVELQQRYAVELDRLVNSVREAIAAHDEAGLLQAMHDLKGILGLFGDARLRQLLDNLDRDLFNGSPARTAQWLDELSAHSRALIVQKADDAD
jgi:two-component system sensor histidine kinase BarA